MLQKSKTTPQLKEWLDRLAPVVEEAKEALKHRKPSKLKVRSGCEQDAEGNFRIQFFGQGYIISSDDFTVRQEDTGKETSSFTSSLILTYLATANGRTPSGRWIGFRELPDGMFYAQAFQGYTGVRLIRELQDEEEERLNSLRRAAEALGGKPVEIGDIGFSFTVFPRVRLAVVYWRGDEDFPSQARVLFEDSAADYMSTDGLAILGSNLVGRILKAAK